MTDDGLATFEQRMHDGAPLLAVAGEIDLSNASDLASELESLPPAEAVICDLSGVRFMDSTGIAAIARFARRMIGAGAHVYVVVTNKTLRHVLQITGLDQHVTVVASLDALP